MTEDFAMGIQPVHVFVTLIASALGVMGFLWKITKTIANLEMKVNMVWEDFKQRYKLYGD